jgi:hypothetical protein
MFLSSQYSAQSRKILLALSVLVSDSWGPHGLEFVTPGARFLLDSCIRTLIVSWKLLAFCTLHLVSRDPC